MASTNKGNGELVYFTYDSAGQRVRKVYEHNGLIEERIYLGGFEIYRRWQAPTETTPKVLKLERETLHVMDGERRIALVETKTVDTSIPAFTPVTVVRLQLGNHLGSAALEVQLDGAVISYEEYHPYGTTAYHSASSAVEVSRERYRYTGKERDEETGLYYHGARYYAPWLGRWTAADPKGLSADGVDLYAYVRGNPLHLFDPSGRNSEETDKQITQMTDVQLHRHLAGLSAAKRASFARSATGKSAERAWATIHRGRMEIAYSFPTETITGAAPKDVSNDTAFDPRFHYAVPGADGRPVPKPVSELSDEALLESNEASAHVAFLARQAEVAVTVGEVAERYQAAQGQLALTAAQSMPVIGTGITAAEAFDQESSTTSRVMSGAGAVLSAAPMLGAAVGRLGSVKGATSAMPLRFAHGTSPASAASITHGGLSAKAAKANTLGGTRLTPGSFFAHEIGPPHAPGEGLQLAYEWGLRHSRNPAVVIGELPGPVVQKLLKSGALQVLELPGMPGVQQFVFEPRAFRLPGRVVGEVDELAVALVGARHLVAC